jgi:choline dehydrogenase-like flavoprotein
MSVVDARLRVYEIENLRIADGSVMPRATTGNTLGPTPAAGDPAAWLTGTKQTGEPMITLQALVGVELPIIQDTRR